MYCLKRVFVLTIIISSFFVLHAQEGSTLEQRLIRLEEGQKHLDKRIDELRADMNARFDALRADMNNRFEDMNRKFNWLYILLAAIIALNGAMVGSVIWMAKQDRPVGKHHYDQILATENELEQGMRQLQKDVRTLDDRLTRLEKSSSGE